MAMLSTFLVIYFLTKYVIIICFCFGYFPFHSKLQLKLDGTYLGTKFESISGQI